MKDRHFAPLPTPVNLQGYGVSLEPLRAHHACALEQVAADGHLWELRVTSVPEPGQARAYIEQALAGEQQGHTLGFMVKNLQTGQWVGTTRYYDITPDLARLDIGYTWYAKSVQRSHVNTATKLLLLEHAFENLNAAVVGWRTDNFNYASQQAILRLGARYEGCIRHHARRRDGTVRDTMIYSLTAAEWPESKAQLLYRLHRHAT